MGFQEQTNKTDLYRATLIEANLRWARLRWKETTSDYEAKIKVLEDKREQLIEVISLLTNKPQIGELILGDKRIIQSGRDYFEQVAGDVTTGESANEPKEDNSEGSSTDATPGRPWVMPQSYQG